MIYLQLRMVTRPLRLLRTKKTGAVKIGAIEDKEGNLVLKPLYIFCISAKRYALANIVKLNGDDYADIDEMKKDAANAHVILRKATGHGLGHVTAPGYISFQPSHDAAPWTETKSAAQLSEPKYGEVCKGRGDPRLFLDLWRMAIMNFITVNNIEYATIVADYMDDTIGSLTGLGLIQKRQRNIRNACGHGTIYWNESKATIHVYGCVASARIAVDL